MTIKQKDEEIVNAWTHLISALICALSFAWVLLFSSVSFEHKLALLPMVGTSIWTFLSSYLYHSQEEPKKKERNRILDKTSIYVMIFGCGVTATLTCRDSAVLVFSCVSLAISIIFLTYIFCTQEKSREWFTLFSYVTVGWLATFPSLGIFCESLYSTTGNVHLILLSGFFYCFGIIFYSRDSIKWFHTIWHFFVMAGMGTHLFTQIYVASITS